MFGETNAHTGRLCTPKAHLMKKEIICAVFNFSIHCAKTVFVFFTLLIQWKNPKLWGVVLRFGPTWVCLCLYVNRCPPSAPLRHGLLPPIQPLLIKLHHATPLLSLCVFLCGLLCVDCRVLGECTGEKFNIRHLLVLANTAGTPSPYHPSLSEVFCPEFPRPNKPCRSTQQQWPVYAELC